MNDNNDGSTYKIGLVMAGAVSAGSYAAGVVDFLIETLDAWYEAKRERPGEVPNHDVELKVIAGSSAGGMTGATAAGALCGTHTPVTSLPGREPDPSVRRANKLYSSWVEHIDIRPLLGDRDLSGSGSNVVSLLDSSILDDIAETAVDFAPRESAREYVADPLQLLLTLTNLRGVPYDITFQGSREIPHRTVQHADYKEFVLSRTDPQRADALWLDPSAPDSSEWHTLRQYALATGAFPGGLAPRSLSRDRDDYDTRDWEVSLRPDPDEPGPQRCSEQIPILPSWPPDMPDEYDFLAVDGGAMNNEPFDLARQTLAGHEGFNARSPAEATRSVLMVDPLPAERALGPAGGQNFDILSVLTALFGSLLTQTRFKPDELMLAHSPRVYSRYMIVPTRRDRNGKQQEHPIASGVLSGFGGFLKKEFRMHDFQLGRRNCQRFLQKYFGIPTAECPENPVFSHYSREELARFSEETSEGEIMPIIPLVGTVHPSRSEEHPIAWRALGMTDEEVNALRDPIASRTKRVVNRLLDAYLDDWLSRVALGLISHFKRDKVVDRIMNVIDRQLEEANLKR